MENRRYNWVHYLIKYTKYAINLLTWGLIIWFVVRLFPKIIVLLMPFVIGWIIASLANPLVRYLESKFKFNRKVMSILAIVLLVSLLSMILYFAISKLVSEATAFASQIPSMYAGIKADFDAIQHNIELFLSKAPADTHDAIIDFINNLSSAVLGFGEKIGTPTIEAAGNFAKNIPNILIAMLLTIMSAYFILSDKENISKWMKSFIPDRQKGKFKRYTQGINNIFAGYLKAQFIIMGIVGIVLFIGLFFLGVKFALLLSVLIALLDFLPFFGTGTALCPWALFHLLSGDTKMAGGLIVIYVLSQLARRIVEPKVLGQTIGLNPLMTMILMYVGFKLFGVLGLILSAPVGMLLINLYSQGMFDDIKFILKDILSDFNQLRDIEVYKG
ncbi:MAG: sporulation integral membrane protein YtvI [Peptostreptococcaceae bacterium]|nr:sporulation integral membrane protein YtvI [Peptostreptococcaceae bacterium]